MTQSHFAKAFIGGNLKVKITLNIKQLFCCIIKLNGNNVFFAKKNVKTQKIFVKVKKPGIYPGFFYK
jgi:hypothetical protein